MLKMISNKLTAIAVLFFVFIMSFPVYADVDTKKDKVATDLRKGDKAPYDGVLLSHRFAAEIKENCSPEATDKKCQIKIDEKEGFCKSSCKNETDNLLAQYDALHAKHKIVISEKDKHIKLLEGKLPLWYENPKLWFAVGVVIGGGSVIFVAKNVK